VRPLYTDEGGYVFAGEHDASSLKHGRVIRFNPDKNGCLMMLRYKTGNLHGKCIMLWHDGRAKTSVWKNGKRLSQADYQPSDHTPDEEDTEDNT
jgi:hypothetical protein